MGRDVYRKDGVVMVQVDNAVMVQHDAKRGAAACTPVTALLPTGTRLNNRTRPRSRLKMSTPHFCLQPLMRVARDVELMERENASKPPIYVCQFSKKTKNINDVFYIENPCEVQKEWQRKRSDSD